MKAISEDVVVRLGREPIRKTVGNGEVVVTQHDRDQGVWKCSTCGHTNVVAAQVCHNCQRDPRTTLTDGTQVYPAHREIDPATGMQRGYVVLSEDERAKGFVRPVRSSYVHAKCGVLTTMSRALAETYARNPQFYSGTFCCGCGKHFPVGAEGEFTWDGSTEKVGT